jgi:hypothetical protein
VRAVWGLQVRVFSSKGTPQVWYSQRSENLASFSWLQYWSQTAVIYTGDRSVFGVYIAQLGFGSGCFLFSWNQVKDRAMIYPEAGEFVGESSQFTLSVLIIQSFVP